MALSVLYVDVALVNKVLDQAHVALAYGHVQRCLIVDVSDLEVDVGLLGQEVEHLSVSVLKSYVDH